jgi:hypothetical protein
LDGIEEILSRLRAEEVRIGTGHFFGLTQGCVDSAANLGQQVRAAQAASVDPAGKDGEQTTAGMAVEAAVEEHR